MVDGLSLADDGVYSEYFLVSFAPAEAESWEYFVIGPGDELVSVDPVYYLTPPYEIALIEDMSGDITSHSASHRAVIAQRGCRINSAAA